MATQKVLKEIKTFLKGKGWDHIERVLKDKRSTYAAQLLVHTQIDEKLFTNADLLKVRISVINSILTIPKIEVEVEEEIKDEALIKDEMNLDIGSVDDLFKTQE